MIKRLIPIALATYLAMVNPSNADKNTYSSLNLGAYWNKENKLNALGEGEIGLQGKLINPRVSLEFENPSLDLKTGFSLENSTIVVSLYKSYYRIT